MISIFLYCSGRIVELDFSELYNVYALKNVEDTNFHGGILINSQFIAVQSLATKGNFNKRLVKDTFYVSHYGLSFPRNHFLYDVVSSRIKKLKSFGIIDLWTSPWLKSRFDNIKTSPPAPKVLNLSHLSIGFEVCLYLLAMASFIFIIELLNKKCAGILLKKVWLLFKIKKFEFS